MRELAAQRLPQILHFLFVDPQVRIARDPELRVRKKLAPLKQVRKMRMDHRGKQQEFMIAFGGRGR